MRALWARHDHSSRWARGFHGLLLLQTLEDSPSRAVSSCAGDVLGVPVWREGPLENWAGVLPPAQGWVLPPPSHMWFEHVR